MSSFNSGGSSKPNVVQGAQGVVVCVGIVTRTDQQTPKMHRF
jgi:hypothetical protein